MFRERPAESPRDPGSGPDLSPPATNGQGSEDDPW
jgi:hypothetical protein